MTQVDALEAVMQALETSDAAVRDSFATEPIARAFPLQSPPQSAVRIGELLKQIDACGGDQSDKMGPRLFAAPSRNEMASSAGILEHQRKHAARVGNVPADKFESAFEQPKPPVPAHVEQRIDKVIASDPALDDLLIGRSRHSRAHVQAPAHDSLIKARYASTILRVARSCDRKMAAHLVAAIASDFPLESEALEIADIHRRAIVSFARLADTLRDTSSPNKQPPWTAAVDTVAVWLRAVEAPETS
jgi:hypothetical protein